MGNTYMYAVCCSFRVSHKKQNLSHRKKSVPDGREENNKGFFLHNEPD